WYFIIIGTMFIPFTVAMIPNYLLIAKLNLIDTTWGVIIPQFADAMGIFLLTQTMREIPVSLLDVAALDNIKQTTVMSKIVFPLTRHAITSTGIWFFITSWNEYVWPVLILRTVDNYTLPLAMQTYISSEGGTNFTVAMAISLITMFVPLVLYAIFQKYIIGTFVSAGIK
ncbi:TPA: carbohydrate ABC transporter permease, partial [Enterococcus faecium]|nr:carbohydrate ABC transporter permease [Enterococcus faecium]